MLWVCVQFVCSIEHCGKPDLLGFGVSVSQADSERILAIEEWVRDMARRVDDCLRKFRSALATTFGRLLAQPIAKLS